MQPKLTVPPVSARMPEFTATAQQQQQQHREHTCSCPSFNRSGLMHDRIHQLIKLLEASNAPRCDKCSKLVNKLGQHSTQHMESPGLATAGWLGPSKNVTHGCSMSTDTNRQGEGLTLQLAENTYRSFQLPLQACR
jgi:hypothetical protein